MASSRRDFLKTTAAAASAMALGNGLHAARAFARDDRPAKGKKLLILGGTGFLGPAIVEVARGRGHTVTLFNRGKTRPHLFPDVEKLQGDRDPKKGAGLKALEGKQWDVVFDDCGYYPRMVKASAELLAPNVKHYIYVSSISAYADNKSLNGEETYPVATLTDPTVETMGENYVNYGGLKALCEQAAEAAMPKKTCVIRPGYIVGPDDPTDRFTYWPVRVEKGGEVMAPGAPADPIQIIDVRDLAAWMVLVAEGSVTGVFNACGPEKKLSMGELLDTCKAASKNDARFTWIPADFLEKQGENGEGQIPIWAPYTENTKGYHTWSNARAVKAGLRFRPVADSVKDTLAWWKAQPDERRAKPRSFLPAELEAKYLAAWKESSAKK